MLIAVLSFSTSAYAVQDSPQTFGFQGRFYDQNGVAPLLDTVNVTIGIYSDVGGCLLYEESESALDLSTTNGMFAYSIGSLPGSPKRTARDSGRTMAQIFANGSSITGFGGCIYTPGQGAPRNIHVAVTPLSTGVLVDLSPDQTINAVPIATVAETLQGIAPTGFIQTNGPANLSQLTVQQLTNASDASTLHNHDSLYVKLSGGTAQSLGTGITYTLGKLGIGTSNPATDLSFGGNAPRTIEIDRSTSTGSGNNLTLNAGGAQASTTNSSGGNLVLSSGTSTGNGGSSIQFQTASPGVSGSLDNAPSTQMVISSFGNVGIGVAAPTSKLQVSGNALISGSLNANYVSISPTGAFALSVAGVNVIDNTGKYVGPIPAGSTGFTGAQGSTGQTGNTGASGATGQTGATGQSGSNGLAGPMGLVGQTGNSGASGVTGSTGQTGNTGASGNTGNTGNSGSNGQTGNSGASGNSGLTGATGQTGNSGASGNTGNTGASGNSGLTGATGQTGNSGASGNTGNTGASGNSGNSGSTGATGQTGNSGASGNTGNTGASGNSGNSGSTGATGQTGNSGASGNTGNTGASGNSGNSGSTGATGQTGNSGASGNTGNSGASGNSGSTGATGQTGNSGASGNTGNSGASGNSGATGQTGNSGASGNTGNTGVSGNSGATGQTGNSGASGNTGASGNSGSTGATGQTGNSGASGNTGNTGASGNSGNSGSTGATGQTGNSGASGNTGTSGNSGASGNSGSTGATGQTGNSGASGNTGNTGASGNSGNSGSTGATGQTGNSGASGNTGNTGASGNSGNSGSTGATGQTGNSGASGNTGNTGASGNSGNSGSTGATGQTGNSGASGNSGNSGSTGSTGQTGNSGASGNSGATGATGQTGASPWGISGTSTYYNLGSVGIGVSGPSVPLHIVKSSAGDMVTVQNTDPTGASDVTFNDNFGTTQMEIGYSNASDPFFGGYSYIFSKSGTNLAFENNSGIPYAMFDTNNGRFGIGTTGPVSKLEVQDQGSTYNTEGGLRSSKIGLDGGDYSVRMGYDTGIDAGYIQSGKYLVGVKPLLLNAQGGNIGIGSTSSSAHLQIAAGTGTAGNAPLKFTAGTNLATPESGAIEFDGTNLYITDNTNTRKTIASGTGAAGQTGATGQTGNSGVTGNTGITGLTGATGQTGTNGASGNTGLSGATGQTGATGSTGQTGSPGSSGNTGATGASPWGISGTSTYYTLGKVGVGVSGPGNLLQVNPAVTSDSLAQLMVSTATGSNKGIVVQGSASQTANLQEWQTSIGNVRTFIDPGGDHINIGGSAIQIGYGISGTAPFISAAGNGNDMRIGNISSLILDQPISPYSSGNIGLQIKGRSGQSSDLQQWQNNSGSVLGVFSASGRLGIATPTPGYSLDVGGTGTVANFGNGLNGAIKVGDGTLSKASGSFFTLDSGLVTNNSISGSFFSPNSIGSASFGNIGMFSPATNQLGFATNASERLRIDASGNVGIGTTGPSARLQIAAGTGSANGAPLKLTAGTNLVTPEAGAIEFDGSSLYYTDNTNTRRALASGSDATKVSKSGDTMTGGLSLPSLNITANAANNFLIQQNASSYNVLSNQGVNQLVISSNGRFGLPALDISKPSYNFNLSPVYGNASLGYDDGVTSGSPAIWASSSVAQKINTLNSSWKGLVIQGVASQTGDLQEWQNSTGSVLASIDSAGKFHGDGSALTIAPQPYVIGGTMVGTLANAQVLVEHPFPIAVTIPAGCTNSRFEFATAATASTTISLQKCTGAGFTSCAQFGTAVIGAGGTVATFTCASATSFVAGTDSILITGPASADTTAANAGWAIYGTR